MPTRDRTRIPAKLGPQPRLFADATKIKRPWDESELHRSRGDGADGLAMDEGEPDGVSRLNPIA